jgi:hypothetical protein
MAGGARGCGVVVSVSFTSPGRLSPRADCCWVRGGTVGESGVVGIEEKKRRRRIDCSRWQKRKKKRGSTRRKEAARCEASTVDQLPLSPTSAR